MCGKMKDLLELIKENSGIIAFIDVLVGMEFHRLNLGILVVCIAILLFSFAYAAYNIIKQMKNDRKMSEAKLQNLNKKMGRAKRRIEQPGIEEKVRENDMKKFIEYHDEREKLRAAYDIRCKKYFNNLSSTVVAFGLILFFGGSIVWGEYRDMHGVSQEGGQDFAGASESSTVNSGMLEGEDEKDGTTGGSINAGTQAPLAAWQIAEMKNKTFILSEPTRLITATKEQMSYVFYVEDKDTAEEAQEKIADRKAAVISAARTDAMQDNSEIEKGVVADAAAAETVFRANQDRAMQYALSGNYDGWKYTIPNSTQLDDIIKQREAFWEEKCNGDLCFLLANDFKTYADEYLLQGGQIETVLYYFVMSIIWTERGLSYQDITVQARETYESFWKARYKDISDYLLQQRAETQYSEWYQRIQKSAERIYQGM